MEALSRIHDRFYRAVYRYIAFRLSNSSVAEDLTNEVFTRFIQALRQKKGPKDSIRSWLLGTASNIVNDHFREKYRVTEVEMSDQIASNTAQPEQIVDQKLREAALKKAMGILTTEQQHVLALRFGDGRSIKEVAKMLNKSEGSIKMLQARAIASLSDRLQSARGTANG